MDLRKHLCADSLFNSLHTEFKKLPDQRSNNSKISLCDALMSGFAMFSLKCPSLLAFDEKRNDEEENINLKTIYGVNEIPCDTQMRTILDEVNPDLLRPAFRSILKEVQRGKSLEQFRFLAGYYLVSLDGTQHFVSEKINSDSCMEKRYKKTGDIKYYQQMLGASIVHPDHKEVLPLCPEMIVKQDGNTKNDCERNAAKRWLGKYRREHPHLKTIILEDSLSSNAPHIEELKKHNCRYILGVKPGDHKFLFDFVESARMNNQTTEYEITDEKDSRIIHKFNFINDVPLNESNKNLKVNFLEYWQITEGKKPLNFSWLVDFKITKDNCYTFMRGGRSRWKIENETFNTLKNQGYNFGHNYGLGKKYLSVIFVLLMMLAFLVDQIQQLCCPLFNAVWVKLKRKRRLWGDMRSFFRCFKFDSMEMLYRALLHGIKNKPPDILKHIY